MKHALMDADLTPLGAHYLGLGSVFGLLEAQAKLYGDNDLLVLPAKVQALWDDPTPSRTYRAVYNEAVRLSEAYGAAGFAPGHRVALSLENRPLHFTHWLALNRLGVSVVPVNPDYKDEEVEYLLSHSGASLLVRLDSHAARLDAVANRLEVPVVGPDGAIPQVRSVYSDDARLLEREAALIYTSGTTGRPKGCMLSNRFFLNWAWWYSAQGGAISLRPGQERLMNPLPAFHVNAMGHSFMGMLGSGGAQVIVDRFHPRDWWATVRETRATAFHYLGVIPAILLQLPTNDEDRQHEVRFALGGGVHPEHHGVFENRFGVPLLEGWAMTETGGAGTLCAIDEPRAVGSRCIGNPARQGPGLDIRLVDENGDDVAQGEPGEVLMRAKGSDPRCGFFSGYLHDPEATEAAWAGGWLHTGDVMRQDENGALYFVDRRKNIIRRSGENISAAEVEAVIAATAGVRQVAVLATLEKLRGEEVFAVVVAEDVDRMALAEAVFAACAERLAYYKVPALMIFAEALPTTSTQKVQREKLRGLAEDPLSRPDCIDWRARKQELRAAGH